MGIWLSDPIPTAPQQGEGTRLPATFGEGFTASWDEGRLFSQSIAGENARMDALGDHLQNLEQKTGKSISAQVWSELGPAIAASGGAPDSSLLLDQINAAAKKAGQPELSSDKLEQAAVEKSRASETAYAAMAGRERTFGGMFVGGLASAVADPINLLTLPMAPEAESVSVLAAALRWSAVAGASQAAIEAAGAPYHEEVQPGYLASGVPLENVLSAAAVAAALGGGTKALGNLWTRVKTGAWPTSVRDAGNVVESEANIQQSNVYPGAEGEVAHRQALTDSIDSILKGARVDVSRDIPPELEARAGSGPIEDARAEAAQAAEQARTPSAPPAEPQPQLPFEATAAQAAAETSNDALAKGVQQISERAGYDMPPEQAAALAQRLVKMAPEEAQDALRDLQVSPQQVAEGMKTGMPVAEKAPEPTPAPDLQSPDYHAAIRADIDRERVNALDRGDASMKIPVDVDKDGNVIHRSVDDAIGEVEHYRQAADQIQACATGAEPEM
jgi:hypothetical protein